MRMLWGVVLLALAVASTGCGTIFHGTRDTVTVNSNPQGAEVLLDGIPVGTTPTQVSMSSRTSHTVVLRLAGVPDQQYTLSTKMQIGFLLLDILTSLVGIVVDSITHGWNVISTDELNVEMGPPVVAAQPPQPQPAFAPPPTTVGVSQ